MSEARFDVVVVGGGPGGTTAATCLAEAGLSVLVVEKESFPRYHIGESLTGVSGDFVRELGLEGECKRLGFVEKPGVKVIGRDARNEFFVPVLRPTWQVSRDRFDQMLLERASRAGAVHRHGTVREVLREGDRVVGVSWQPAGGDLERVHAHFVVDASGHAAFASRQGIAGPRRTDAFGRQVAAFAQFRGAVRDAGPMGGNTLIFYRELHHWAWFIPVSDELVSVGVVLPSHVHKQHGGSPEQLLRFGLASVNPDLTRRMERAEPVEQARFIANYSYRIEPFAGDGWAAIGEAHRFTDPIFSFGVAFAMVEAKAVSRAIVDALREGRRGREVFAEYVELSNRGHEAIYDFIRYFWKYPAFFSFLSRGSRRDELVRLLAGDVFGSEELSVLAEMRRSLRDLPLDGLPERAREIATRVHSRFAIFQGVDGAYLEVVDDSVRLSFVLSDFDPDLLDCLHDFEEALYRDTGRDELVVLRWDASSPQDVPSFAGAFRIFDRRRP